MATEAPQPAWPEPAESPAWSDIADEAESAGPGSAEPGPAPDAQPEAQPAAEAARSRRPSSLRSPDAASTEAPRGTFAPPAFPGSPGSAPGQPPVSEPAQGGRSGHVPNPASLRKKLPLGRLPLGKLPLDKLPAGQLRTLVKQRPEVGLGLAFAGGLVIATILKRLGRR